MLNGSRASLLENCNISRARAPQRGTKGPQKDGAAQAPALQVAVPASRARRGSRETDMMKERS